MSKTQEELQELKEEYETLNNKLKELSEDELKLVVGGGMDYEPTIDDVAGSYIQRAAKVIYFLIDDPLWQYDILWNAYHYLVEALMVKTNDRRISAVASAIQCIDSANTIPEFAGNMSLSEAKNLLQQAQIEMGV